MAENAGEPMKRILPILLVILLLVVILLLWFIFLREEQPPTLLRNGSGDETAEFQLLETVVLDAIDLRPRTGYEIFVVRDDGEQVAQTRLSTDGQGRILAAPVWYGIGLQPCPAEATHAAAVIPEPLDISIGDHDYRLILRRGEQVVRELQFRVAAAGLRPTVYATDARGCPKTGFLIGEEDVWVRGRNLPPGSIVRLWAVPAQGEWSVGDALEDRTRRYDGDAPPVFELRAGASSFHRLLWPRGLTSVGSYDIVAEWVHYPVGDYHGESPASVSQIVANIPTSGFVIQRRPEAAEPLEMDIAGTVQSPFTYRSTFLSDENVYVGVDPAVQPSYVGETADVYVVPHKTEAEWVGAPSLPNPDITGYVERLTVYGICGNFWKTLAWAAPLTVDEYDVVLDFNQNGQYDAGVDLIDALDPVGFTVAEMRVDAVSFNYSGAGAITLYDETVVSTVTAPEFVSVGNVVKPAAWVQGGTHTVEVSFRAVSSVNSAQVWAEDGLGGLASGASPVTVSLSGGVGQATFNVNSPPAAVARTAFTWRWQYKNVNGASTATESMGETGEHLLYTVVAPPKAPQSPPWVGTLEVATTVASGQTTAADATRAIWYDFYHNAGGQYDTHSGASKYTGSTTANFNLTLWLSEYNSGGIGTVNCYDMGKAVVVFANALGADAVYTYVGPFGYLNAVRPVGRGWTNNPFYDNPSYDSNPMIDGDPSPAVDGDCNRVSCQRSSFANHGFTRLANQIFDGSGGQVDVDPNRDYGPPHTAYDLNGFDSWPASYRDRVIDDIPASLPGAPADHSFGVY